MNTSGNTSGSAFGTVSKAASAYFKSIFMAYSDIGHDFTEGGTPICVFRNPNETPTAYHAQSFATSNGGTLIVHDAASLRRFLSEHRYIRFLAPSAYVRWNHAYTELARRPRHDTKAAPALRVAA